MNETDRRYLIYLAATLDTADRIGEKQDNPEGIRCIQISDKLADIIYKNLLDIVARDAEDERQKIQGT